MSSLVCLLCGRRPSALKTASATVLRLPSLAAAVDRRYSGESGGIIDKEQAVSTAEVFLRQAKEKAESATEKAKESSEEVIVDVKEAAVLGETKQEEEDEEELKENEEDNTINQD